MRKILLLTALVGLVVVTATQAQRLGWWFIERGIRVDFPDVPQLTTDALAQRLAHGERVVLLDVRTEAEYAVSHLRGAQRVDPDHPDLAALADLPRDAPIVAYCSVGYRSSALVEKLQRQGFTNVANLKGSLFRWANEGRPVVRDGRDVGVVHPYNATWGRLLDKVRRADVPSVGAEGEAAGSGN